MKRFFLALMLMLAFVVTAAADIEHEIYEIDPGSEKAGFQEAYPKLIEYLDQFGEGVEFDLEHEYFPELDVYILTVTIHTEP